MVPEPAVPLLDDKHHPALAAKDVEGQGAARGFGRLGQRVDRLNRLAIDGHDDVASAKSVRRGRAVGLDARDRHALRPVGLGAALDRAEGGARETRNTLRGLGLLLLALADLHEDRLDGLLAHDLEFGLLADPQEPDAVAKVGATAHGLATDGRHDVTRLEARLVGRRIGLDAVDEGARGLVELERLGDVGRQVLNRDADPAAPDFATSLVRFDLDATMQDILRPLGIVKTNGWYWAVVLGMLSIVLWPLQYAGRVSRLESAPEWQRSFMWLSVAVACASVWYAGADAALSSSDASTAYWNYYGIPLHRWPAIYLILPAILAGAAGVMLLAREIRENSLSRIEILHRVVIAASLAMVVAVAWKSGTVAAALEQLQGAAALVSR